MTQELDLVAKSLAWIVAPTGILLAGWFFVARYAALLRALMEALKTFCEAQRIQRQCRALEAAPRETTAEKSAAAMQRLVWLGRDRDRSRAEGFNDLRTAALELGKSVIPFAALLGFGVLFAAPWDPACSPVTYISEMLRPEAAPADTSLEFIADAGMRFQDKIAELNTALADTRSERDRLATQLSSLKAAIASAELSPAQRRTLLGTLERPADSNRTPPVSTTATTGAPATSLSSNSPPASTATPTPAPPIATPPPTPQKKDAARSREILKELTTRWAPCINELEVISNRGPDGEKFANWVQPRLLNLLRSESEKETDLVLRELLAAFDTDKRLVAASPILTRVDQLLRQLDILLHGI